MQGFKVTKKHHKHLNNPFPSTPESLPFLHGNLSFNPQTVSEQQVYHVGNDFLLNWSSINGGYLSVSHQSQPNRAIWSTIPGQPFVSAAFAETEVEESRGSFAINDRDVHLICNHQSIEDIKVINHPFDIGGKAKSHVFPDLKNALYPFVIITGRVFFEKNKKHQKLLERPSIHSNMDLKTKGMSAAAAAAKYWVLFDQKNKNQIGFQVNLGKPNFELYHPEPLPRTFKRFRGPKQKQRLGRLRRRRIGWYFFISRLRSFIPLSSSEDEKEERKFADITGFNRVCITYSSEKDERFYGFGEQFSHMEFKGKRVPIFVQEQGIGRGDQPITFAANLLSFRAGGDWSTTYAPSPFYMTSKMRSLYLEGYSYSVFDLTKPVRVQIMIHGDSVQGRILHGSSPCELIEQFTESIGRPPELPPWIISGATVGMQGGTDAVRDVWELLKDYDVPISAFWLQDWVGQRKTMIGSQLWWNWEVDTEHYKGWRRLVKDLGDQDIKVMTYCNPCLAPVDGKPNSRRNLFEEAKKLDILVKYKNGETYMVPNTAFDVGMLDLTHPHAAPWFKKILQEMVDDGVRGWMADFGEGLPLDVSLYSGEDPVSAHNRYTELWAEVNREFVEERKSTHVVKEKEDPKEALVFFMRAGFRESPKWGMLFWEGDQMVSWQANDGIKSAVVGLLSSGLSGYAFNHSDIGGYCTVNFPFFKYRRSEELLLRWMELNAFSMVFRTHEGNNPSINSQFYSNDRTLLHFARFAKVYKAWNFYRIQLMKEAAQKGLPICRHLFLHFAQDDYVHNLTYQQFLVGTEILVVPILDKGEKEVKVYFPVGEGCSWQHIWTGKVFTEEGVKVRLEAPIGYPAIFVKFGSPIGETFLKNLRDFGIL
ncbi:sulfoquinovosidase-like [Macadamia integrifolia]|uniref:sulfoquinovosidase-like n=1 Tax=Macadamia integrifolia TaxID=60698 RepID=UPI001C4E7050|nr:sulfoquinovosidase-like [Macadamia integrifolia]